MKNLGQANWIDFKIFELFKVERRRKFISALVDFLQQGLVLMLCCVFEIPKVYPTKYFKDVAAGCLNWGLLFSTWAVPNEWKTANGLNLFSFLMLGFVLMLLEFIPFVMIRKWLGAT